ncbi:MAG: acyltransferase [Firmicutes bacterium]|nr:acyltransferase [Bacillota bacterium]
MPLYPKLIRLHNNVAIHKTAVIITHDMVDGFLKKARPDMGFGHRERLGCIEIMDNVYVANEVIIMPNVRIGKNCIISTGSVVTQDIPENSVVAGNPAKVVGRFDIFCAMRRMRSTENVKFRNQKLPDELAKEHWNKFEQKHTEKKENTP